MQAAAQQCVDPLRFMYLQGLPLAEVNITAGAISVAFDDNRGQDSDCSNTHLKLRGQRLDLLLEFVQGGVAAKVCQPCPCHRPAILYCVCFAMLKIWPQTLLNCAVLVNVCAQNCPCFRNKACWRWHSTCLELCFAAPPVLYDTCPTHVQEIWKASGTCACIHPSPYWCRLSLYAVLKMETNRFIGCPLRFRFIAMQATVLQLHASDRSKYNSKVPKIFGCYSVPRLAQVMTIDSLTVRVDHSQADGLLVSGRLLGAAARGWPHESGNIISRSAQHPTSCPACLCSANPILPLQLPAVLYLFEFLPHVHLPLCQREGMLILANNTGQGLQVDKQHSCSS